jgi:hypothetical protein
MGRSAEVDQWKIPNSFSATTPGNGIESLFRGVILESRVSRTY